MTLTVCPISLGQLYIESIFFLSGSLYIFFTFSHSRRNFAPISGYCSADRTKIPIISPYSPEKWPFSPSNKYSLKLYQYKSTPFPPFSLTRTIKVLNYQFLLFICDSTICPRSLDQFYIERVTIWHMGQDFSNIRYCVSKK